MKRINIFFFGLGICLSGAAFAANNPDDGTWADRRHDEVHNRINRWAHKMDGWFGTPDPDKPASANLRIMLDTEWNKYDEFSVKPRVRGKVKLPVLQRKLNVVFGDDSLDDDLQQEATAYRNTPDGKNKTFDTTKTRDSNSSLALRWSDITQKRGIETDFDLGVRSGDDIYARAKAAKSWQLDDRLYTRLEQIYRYGLDSKHHVRTNWETRYLPKGNAFIANQLYLQYEHDDKEDWTWGNSLYRQHDLSKHRYFNYGVYTGGKIDNKKAKLNSYGPFTGYRQPVWRDWLFAQTELNYYNDREKNRSHHIGALLRLEALF